MSLDRYQRDPERYRDHLEAPRGRGRLPAGGYSGGAGGSACGDFLTLGLKLEDGIVVEAGFTADACSATTAAASAVIELIEGAPVIEAARIDPVAIESELGGLRPEFAHAAGLASDALHRAISAAAADSDCVLAAAADARTLVAMSGGVDSAVAALELLAGGRTAVAVTLQLWDDPATNGKESCCSPQAVASARRLAHSLGIAHITLDLRDGFRRGVVDPYLDAFEHGLTPNPCVGCNGHVRFDALDALRDRLGARTLATGHYARILDDGEGPLLAAAAYGHKDQTYMLAALSADLLSRLEFPLGELTKPEVRGRARAAGLAVAEKAESQDLCFLAGVGRDRFLSRHGHSSAVRNGREGEIIDRQGTVLGRHGGAHRFTVGQRRGLGIGGGEPLYVTAVDAASNQVTVGRRAELKADRVLLRGARLLRDGARIDRVKLRYRSEPVAAALVGVVEAGSHRVLELLLPDGALAAAPGQIACLLDGETVIGWATIVRGCSGVADQPDGRLPDRIEAVV